MKKFLTNTLIGVASLGILPLAALLALQDKVTQALRKKG